LSVPSRFIHFTGNPAENGAYIGLPLLALFAVGLFHGMATCGHQVAGLDDSGSWRCCRWARISMSTGRVTPIWLPWAALAWLPLLGSALPGRLMSIAFSRRRHRSGLGVLKAFKRSRSWRVATGVMLVVGFAAVLPSFPSMPYPSQHAAVPAFFKPGGGVERIPPGSVLLVTPFSRQGVDGRHVLAVSRGLPLQDARGRCVHPGSVPRAASVLHEVRPR